MTKARYILLAKQDEPFNLYVNFPETDDWQSGSVSLTPFQDRKVKAILLPDTKLEEKKFPTAVVDLVADKTINVTFYALEGNKDKSFEIYIASYPEDIDLEESELRFLLRQRKVKISGGRAWQSADGKYNRVFPARLRVPPVMK